MAISLDNVASGQRLKAPKIVLYGVGGIGKTTFAAGAPKPIFIFTEEGQGTLAVDRIEPHGDPLVRTWFDLYECCKVLLEQDHDYQTVVIDSLDFAEPLLWAYTAQRHEKQDIEAFGYGKGYSFAVAEAKLLLDLLDRLRDEKNMAVILICHSHTVKFKDPEFESYDVHDLRLHAQLADHVDFWSDAILFANYRVAVTRDDEGFNKTRARAVGVSERVLYTEKRPAFRAKNRYGLPVELPLEWQAFQQGVAARAAPQSSPPPAAKPKTEAKPEPAKES